MLKQSGSFFLSERGRKLSFAIVTGCAIGATALKFIPHTFLLYKYKELVHHHRDSKPVELSKEIRDRVEKCLDLLKFSAQHRKLLQPFSVFGFDLFNAGTFKSKYGVALGVPVNFSYKSLADIEKQDIEVNQKPVDWTSESGRKLAEALLLTEDEQEFALCREILSGNNFKVLLQSSYPIISVLFAYTFAQNINMRFNLYALPTPVRSVVYMLISIFAIGIYFLFHDYTEVHYETLTDKELCSTHPKFIDAGISFYDKILKRNQALRELMGSEGEKLYSVKGNENFFIRQPRVSLMHRKMFFESQKEESEEIE